MRRSIKMMSILVVVAAILVFISGVPAAQAKEKKLPRIFAVASLPTGSFAHTFLTGMAKAVEKHTPMTMKLIPLGTDVGRTMAVRQGQCHITQYGVPQHYVIANGLEQFGSPEWGPQRIRTVFSGAFYDIGLFTRKDTGIKTLADVKGRKVSKVAGHFASQKGTEGLLKAVGLTWKDVVVVDTAGYMDGIKAVRDGASEVGWATSASPIMKQIEVAPTGLRWLTLPPPREKPEFWEKLYSVAPFYSPLYATAGAGWADNPGWSLEYRVTVSSYDFVDEEIIYRFVDAIVKGYDFYKDVHPKAKLFTPKGTFDPKINYVVAWHPGAVRWAKENGFWSDEHEKIQQKYLADEEKRVKEWEAKKK